MADRRTNAAGPDISSQYQGLRISAQPFVPNVNAVAFQPGASMFQGPQGDAPYPSMGGHTGVYGGHHHYHCHPSQLGYMGSGAPLDYHRMPPGDQYYNMRQPQYHQPFTASGGSGNYYTSTAGSLPQQSPVSHTTAVLESNPPTSDQVEVDSWEQIVTETEPIGTKGSVTNEDVATIPSQPLDADIERHVLADEGPDKVPFEPSSINITTNTSTVNATLPVAATISQSSSSSSPSVDRNTLPKDPTPSKMTSSIKTVLPPPRDMNDKESVSIVFIGHVDAGKSTIGGHIMYLTGQVDKRTLEKYEREAKEKNRETWYLSWALDTNQEERDKGKTVEVGQALFETDRKRFTILDAPGHAGYVPNMIGGTVQADIGVLVISARRGEFETGFEKGGQTREHAMLAKTAGMRHLVILINKMDDPTVNWSIARFEECKTKLTPFLKKVGFNPKTDLHYIPVSGLTGANLKEKFTDPCVAWYKGPPFIIYLDGLPPIPRDDDGPFRMAVAEKFKEMGTVVTGKIETGSVCKGSMFIIMPNRTVVEVLSVLRAEEEIPAAYSGDNIKLKLKGIDDEDISPGFVLCSPHSLCSTGRVFDAQVVILEYKSIICAGFSCVLHMHNAVEEVEIIQLIAKLDKKTGKKIPEKPTFLKQDFTAIARFQTSRIICIETFKDFPPMARFSLRDEGKTIGIGKVLKILE